MGMEILVHWPGSLPCTTECPSDSVNISVTLSNKSIKEHVFSVNFQQQLFCTDLEACLLWTAPSMLA